MSDAPSHVAIIMDGNSRWAKKNKLTKKEGHRAGVKAAKNIIEYAISGITSNISYKSAKIKD